MGWPKKPEQPLSSFELRFVAAFDGKRTQTECYEHAAGRKIKSAVQSASDMMRDVRITNAIAAKQTALVQAVGEKQGEDMYIVAAKYGINIDRIFREYNTLLASGDTSAGVKARCLEALSKIFGLIKPERANESEDPHKWPAERFAAIFVPAWKKEYILAEREGRRPNIVLDADQVGPGNSTAKGRPQ